MRQKLLTLLTISMLSCMPEEELPMKNMGDISGYFIECYCKPGEAYSLNATNIFSITNNIGQGFPPVNLNVVIRANTAILLAPQTSSNLLVNFRHDTPLADHGIDTLYLDIHTVKNEHIMAKTTIPEKVEISSHSVSKATNSVSITFQTSRYSTQNYYIFTVQGGNSDDKKETTFLNLTHTPGGSTVEKTIKYPQITEIQSIAITLMRITKECYNYQISLYEANSANQGSITSPVPLCGNIQGALGIFTCYTECTREVFRDDFE